MPDASFAPEGCFSAHVPLSSIAAGERPQVVFNGPEVEITHRDGDTFDIDAEGNLRVKAGAYAVTVEAIFNDPGAGDATWLAVNLSDYEVPRWGPVARGGVFGGQAHAVAASTYRLPEGDTLYIDVDHDASAPKDLFVHVWVCAV